MGIKDKALAFGKKFKLDSHHATERFGIIFGVLAASGAVILASTGVAAFTADRNALADTAAYTTEITTSKTKISGALDGVYVNELGDKALVMMSFGDNAQMSFNAEDYQAFLLGSNTNLEAESVKTRGVKGSFFVFGSTGYYGVLLEADEPFQPQVLNLTMRANAELVTQEDGSTSSEADQLLANEDQSFAKYDQWRMFVNPGARDAKPLASLDSASFDPAQAYYEIVLDDEEAAARDALDASLLAMRADQQRITTYTDDLAKAKVDGLFLRPPAVPESIRDDQVIGESAVELGDENGESTLELETAWVSPGGFDFDWRDRSIYDGYLEDMLEPDQSYTDFLIEKSEETASETPTTGVSDMQWVLSDGTNLNDYRASDVAMRPLTNVMNNLSQAYQDYISDKQEYQLTLLPALLDLEVELRNVQSNSSIRDDDDFLVTYVE